MTPYHYVFNNPVKNTDPDGRCPNGDCPDGGPGNGLSLVENLYLEGRDNLVSGIKTAISWAKSVVSGDQMQEAKMVYSNGEASVSMTNVPEGGKLKALGGAALNIFGSIPGGGGPAAAILVKTPGVKNGITDAIGNLVKTESAGTKLSKVKKEVVTESIGNFTKKTEIRPGNGPGQSRAEITRVKNSEGKTVKTYKDSYDRANVFQHRKPLRGGPEGRPQDD